MTAHIAEVINNLYHEAQALRAALCPLLESASDRELAKQLELSEYVTENCKALPPDPDKGQGFEILPRHFQRFRRLTRDIAEISTAQKLLPGALLVSLMSRYDAFIGGMVRAAMLEKPGIIDKSEKPITFSELVSCDSVASAREMMVAREIDSVLRDDAFEQLKWFDKKINTSLYEHFSSKEEFVELKERRNAIVHSDGVVTSQ